jgi:hypothetical protein
MNWKISIAILIELGFLCFPANIIGCADPPDPYDDYITFFRNDVAPAKGFNSFYYVADAVIYDPLAPAADSTDYITRMWVRYCEGSVTVRDVDRLVNKSSKGDMASLYAHLQKLSTPIAPNIRDNPMVNFLVRQHDSVAVKYLLLAKEAEEYTGRAPGSRDDQGEWTLRPKDSIGMSTLIAKALQGLSHSKKDFFRARYGFQAERLAFYNHRYQDCIRFYDELVRNNPASGHLARVGLAYKAGAFWHTGRRIEAAYGYSRSFTANPNTSDYLSFSWCVHRLEDSDRRLCMEQCLNDREKAEMLGLFVLGSTAPEETALETIDRLAPGTPVQEVLAVREVNKIEQNYFTQHLARQKGGRAINQLDYYVSGIPDDKWLEEATALISFYDSVGRNNKVAHPGLFLTVASQLCYITQQFGRGDSLLNRAGALPATEKLRDQQKMTRLLLTINETAVVDQNFEKALLPSLQWLEQRAHRDSLLKVSSEWSNLSPGLWSQIYRNLLSEELAKRYYRQKDHCSEVLCIGAAEQAKGPSAGPTLSFVREQMTAAGLIRLLRLLQDPNKTDWQKFLVSQFPVPVDQVTEVIATAHIREYRFHEALKWMRRVKDQELLHLDRNPFADLLFDNQDSVFGFDKGRFNKRTFIAEMAALSDKVGSHIATAKDLYRLATGYYNLTYYGRAWELVRYYRSGNEAVDIPDDKTDFDKDYYGCYTAEAFFRKAMAASVDPEFKARCLFMMAKCSQKQVPMVAWYAPDWDVRNHEFIDKFENNKHFPQLVAEYGNTGLYREAFNTCSYLRDFKRWTGKSPNAIGHQ